MRTQEPIYLQLADLLRERISSGEYVFGDSLPSEHAMAEKYGISHLTVRKALSVLAQEDLVSRIQGKGTFVKAPRVFMDMNVIGGFSSFLQNKGIQVTNKVLHAGTRKAKYRYARIFHIEEQEEIFECTRLRLGDGVPMAVEYNAVPVKYAQDIKQYDYKVYSLHDVYMKNGIRVVSEHQLLEVVNASESQAKLLNLQQNDSIFLLTSRAMDDQDRIVEYTRIFNSDERLVFYAAAD